ncbi:MAG: GntR family transcriptional regulator [Lachnospiraceae bacterium]|nr:GntR family transcriptional regulator [Lachnospiraceae bacterium]
MNINISNTSSVPIYEQIEQQIKNMIVSGALQEGDMLPSMRFLAKELRISLITTKRAYEELERDGFIETRVGIGCFVKAKNQGFIREKVMCEIEEHFEDAVIRAQVCDIPLQELVEILTIIYEEHTK